MNAPNGSLDTRTLDTRTLDTSSPALNAATGAEVPRNRLLIVGCGYLGIRVARLASTRGDQVWATTRRPERAAELEAEGISPLVVDWTDRRTMRELPEIDGVLVAVSYDPRGGADRETAIVGGLSNLLEAIGAGQIETGRGVNSPRLCYISTTGVYHQSDGRWVDETSPTHPRREGGRAHLRAERTLHRAWPGGPWTILRLAGIYGPGRVPRVADVIAGRPLASSDRGFLNLIHVDDAAAAAGVVLGVGSQTRAAGSQTRAAGSQTTGPDAGDPSGFEELYVVADDRPVVRGEFYREVARQAGVDPPRFVTSPDGATGKAPWGTERTSPPRGGTDKRVWNRRMKRDLLPRLRYPSYRDGLADVLGRPTAGPTGDS